MRGPTCLLAIVLVVAACTFPGRADESATESVLVGSGPESESTLVAHVFAALLAAQEIPAEVKSFDHRRDARQAIELGEVEVVPAYTGAVWLDELGWSDPPGDPRTSYERISRADAGRGLVWLPPTGVNATFTFVVRGVPATSASMEVLDDLALVVNQAAAGQAPRGEQEDDALDDPPPPSEARLCVDPAFASRADGLEAFARLYSLREEVLTSQLVLTDPDETVQAVADGRCLGGLTTATDGVAWLQDLHPLRDDLKIFPAFVLAPVVREELESSRSEVVAALEPFGAAVTNQRLASWNGRVSLGEPVETVAAEVAQELLAEHGATPSPES